jgi:hypothetical protein
VNEILASREVTAQDQEQGDLKERAAQIVDRKLPGSPSTETNVKSIE